MAPVKAQVQSAVERFVVDLGSTGHAGVWFEHLATGDVVQFNATEVFPAASVIKVPVLVAAYRLAASGKLDLDSLHRLRESAKIAGSGVLKELHAGLELTLRDLLTLMIVISVNTATNMVIDLAGMTEVARTIHDLGLRDTALRRLLVGGAFSDRADYSLAIDNTVTAVEMGRLLKRLVEGRAVSVEADEAMLALLARQQVNDRIPRLLPHGTMVAHKTGELRDVRHDAAVVYSGDRPSYILVVLTRNLAAPLVAATHVAQLSLAIYKACCSG